MAEETALTRFTKILFALFPFGIIALCLWATIPYGGVARWAWASIVTGIFALSLVAWFLGSMLPGPNKRPSWVEPTLWTVGVVTLFGWGLYQLKPVPIEQLKSMQPGAAETYDAVFVPGSTPEAAPLAFDPLQTRMTLVSWAAYALLIWVIARMYGRKGSRIERACLCIAVVGSLQAILGMVTREVTTALNQEIGAEGGKWAGHFMFLANEFRQVRFNGTFSGPNTFGGFLAITLPITLSLLLKRSTELFTNFRGSLLLALNDRGNGRVLGLSMVWLGLGALVQLVSLVMSGSRGASIAMTVACLGLLALYAWKARELNVFKTLVMFTGLIAAAITIMVGSGFFVLLDRFHKLADADLSMRSRIEIWQASLEMVRDHPLGVGAGSYREAIPRYQEAGFGDIRIDLAHNDYLQLWCELGWVGLIPVGLLVLLFFRRSLRVFGMSAENPMVWMGIGLFMSLLAGLLHAGVDFNLSSRPGVTVTFCLVAGLLLGSTCGARLETEKASESKSESSQSSSKGRRRRRSSRRGRRDSTTAFSRRLGLGAALGLIGLAVAGIAGSRTMIRGGQASDHLVRGWQAVGGERYAYQWKHPGYLDPSLADREFQQALELQPEDGILYNVLGRAIVLTNDATLAEVVSTTRTQVQEADLPQSMQEVAIEAAYRMKLDTLKPSYQSALENFRQAVWFAPWRPDAHAWYGRYLCATALHDASALEQLERGDALPKHTRDQIDHGIRHLEVALRLGPNDTTTVLSATHGWVEAFLALRGEEADEAKARIKDLGNRVLTLGSKNRQEIIQTWYDAGISLEEMLDIQNLPLASLHDLYKLYREVEDAPNCMKVLDLMDEGISGTNVITGLRRTNDEGREEAFIESVDQFVTVNRARWQLSLGQVDQYAASAEIRRRYWLERVARGLEEQVSDAGIAAALEGLDKRFGLPLTESLQIARVHSVEGESLRANRRLFRVGLQENVDRLALRDGRWWTESTLDAVPHPGAVILEARHQFEEGRPDQARALLLPFLQERSEEVPVAYRHRIRWLNARCQRALGLLDAAGSQLREGFEMCNDDPSIPEMAVALGLGEETVVDEKGQEITWQQALDRLTPDTPVHMHYQGERMELTGIDLEEIGDRGRIRLTSYWRFWGSAPSDLEVLVLSHTRDGRTRFNQGMRFRTVSPLIYGSGDPRQGVVIPVEVDLPSFVKKTDSLELRLRRNALRENIWSDEALGFRTWKWRHLVKPAESR